MIYRNQKYLDWIRETQSCLVSRKKAEVAHHVRENDNTSGVGLKPSDYRVLPLLHSYHTTGSSAIHRIGPLSFYKKFAINPLMVMVNQMKNYLKAAYEKTIDHPAHLEGSDLLDFYEKAIEELRPKEEKEKELERIKNKKERVRKNNREKRKELKEDEGFQKATEQKKKFEKMLYEKNKDLRPKQKLQQMSEQMKQKQKAKRKEYLDKVKEESKELMEERKKKQKELRKLKYRRLKELKKQWDSQKNP